MTNLSPTLMALLRLGFERRPPNNGMETVGYQFRHLDLTASDGSSAYFSPVVLLSGVLRTDRSISLIIAELPPTLERPEEAAAWVSFNIQSERRNLVPLPDWMLEGERNWDLIPLVRRQREYAARPRCCVDREYARTLRRQLQQALSELTGDAVMSFKFDGRILSICLGDREFAVVATGNEWPSVYRVTVSSETTMPARFRSPSVELSYHEGTLKFGAYSYRASETTA